jgi:hypothetical protein
LDALEDFGGRFRVDSGRIDEYEIFAILGCEDTGFGGKVDGFDVFSFWEDGNDDVGMFRYVAGRFSDDDFTVVFIFCDEFLEDGLGEIVDV